MVGSRIRYFGGAKGWYADEKVRGSMFLCLHMHFVDQLIDLFGDPAWVDATRFVTGGEGGIHSGTIMLGFPEQSDNFVARVLKGAPPLISQADSRRAIEVCLLAERSAKLGSRIKC